MPPAYSHFQPTRGTEVPRRIEPDTAICGLMDRLCKLIDAKSVVAVELDRLHRFSILGAAGVPRQPNETCLLDIRKQLDSAVIDSGGRGDDRGALKVARMTVADGLDVLAIGIDLDNDSSLLIVAARDGDGEPFGVNEERATRRVGGWILDYVRLWSELRSVQRVGNGLRSALDLVDNAVFVLDEAGRLVSASTAALAMLEAGDGLRRAGDMITAAALEDAMKLQAAVAHARADGADEDAEARRAPMLSIRRRGRRPLFVAVMRGQAEACGKDCAVVIHAVDPEAELGARIAPTCEIYGFTAAESRLTCLLVGGASLTEAASRLRIQAPTARTYLKQVFAKTGTNRQAALVQLLLNSMVRTSPEVELTALR